MKTSFLPLVLAACCGMVLPVSAQSEEAPSQPQVIIAEPGQRAIIDDEEGMTISVNMDELAGDEGRGPIRIDADALLAECPEAQQFMEAMLELSRTLEGISDAEGAAAAVGTVKEQLAHLRAISMLADSALQAQPEEKRNQLSFVLMMSAFKLSETVNKLADAQFFDCAELHDIFLPQDVE